LVFLLILANDRELMGPNVNSRTTNFLGVLITVLVTAAGSAYALVAFWQTFSAKSH
jgi:Mn2+/Fe2+ NRAMP family transporter